MAKYHQLLEKYAEQISAILLLQEKVNAARAKLTEIERDADDDNYDPAPWESAAQVWQNLSDDLGILQQELTQDIEHEYWDVPFAKPREQGIKRFFDLAGL